jgi:YesN/AraC family two-component response regulator
MLKVLIVEDDSVRLQRIAKLLTEIPGIDIASLREARSSHQARLLMEEGSFDILILDINLPRQLDEEPRPGRIRASSRDPGT